MKTKNRILELLEENKGKALSGEEIAAFLSLSRNSVWKAINALKKDGYDIFASTNKGYVLNEKSDILSKESIKVHLKDKTIKVIYKESTTSTNDDLLKLAQEEKEQIVLEVASKQTLGRGRLGRTFISPKGGIYFSILIALKEVDAKDVTIITPMAAVAIARAIKNTCGKDLHIKWVNDLYKGDKKVCGVLTQANFDIETNTISSVVVGIGLDYQIDLSAINEELKPIIGSIYDLNEKAVSKSEMVANIVNEFLQLIKDINNRDFYNEYKEKSLILNKRITFKYNNEQFEGVAEDIDCDCALIVRLNDGTTMKLNSGEVSIKQK